MSIHRKLRAITNDPVLRRWLLGYFSGRWEKTKIKKSKPPYLDTFTISKENTQTNVFISETKYPKVDSQFSQKFAGKTIVFDSVVGVNEEDLKDTESQNAFHRFSWIVEPTSNVQAGWVLALWNFWLSKYRDDKGGQAWHPYTASERLINLLRFFLENKFLSPGSETLEVLCEHGPHIYENLEYYGEKNTGNHLLNNGRGLYLGGVMLGAESWIEIGRKIILNESERLFNSTGELREGSVHYHLLITSWYLECWLAAKATNRSEEGTLLDIVTSCLSAASFFNLPGGVPLVGDVSPDCTPNYLQCILTGKIDGWLLNRTKGERQLVSRLITSLDNRKRAKKLDDWWRFDLGPWSIIWPKVKSGWQPYPGHSHLDFGGFELHFSEEKIFVDIGRRSYDRVGDIDKVETAHNVLTINKQPAYPENRAYYNEEFRNSIVETRPEWSRNESEVSVATKAFSRISGVGSWTRKWIFADNRLVISDVVTGRGCYQIDRFLHTILKPEVSGSEIICGPIRIAGATKPVFSKIKYWSSYGQGVDAYTIKIPRKEKLPFTGKIEIYLS